MDLRSIGLNSIPIFINVCGYQTGETRLEENIKFIEMLKWYLLLLFVV